MGVWYEQFMEARGTTVLGCSLIELPFNYLGFSSRLSMRQVSSWNPILQKIKQKLASWKARTLSRAGRLVLIKAVLNSLPLYFFSLFKMPKLVAKKIIQIQRRFLWAGEREGHFSALVKWEVVQLPKSMGGLGVGDILMKNACLLFK